MDSLLKNNLVTLYKEEMISFLNSNPKYFDEAIKLAISDDQPYSWRSAWLLWSCMDKNDKRVANYINAIVDTLKSKKDGHQRELLKILYNMELNKKYEGIIFDICMTIWEQIDKSPSVRFMALKFIIKIAKKDKYLFEEIEFLTQNHYLETLSPGIKRSIEKMMKIET